MLASPIARTPRPVPLLSRTRIHRPRQQLAKNRLTEDCRRIVRGCSIWASPSRRCNRPCQACSCRSACSTALPRAGLADGRGATANPPPGRRSGGDPAENTPKSMADLLGDAKRIRATLEAVERGRRRGRHSAPEGNRPAIPPGRLEVFRPRPGWLLSARQDGDACQLGSARSGSCRRENRGAAEGPGRCRAAGRERILRAKVARLGAGDQPGGRQRGGPSRASRSSTRIHAGG